MLVATTCCLGAGFCQEIFRILKSSGTDLGGDTEVERDEHGREDREVVACEQCRKSFGEESISDRPKSEGQTCRGLL